MRKFGLRATAGRKKPRLVLFRVMWPMRQRKFAPCQGEALKEAKLTRLDFKWHWDSFSLAVIRGSIVSSQLSPEVCQGQQLRNTCARSLLATGNDEREPIELL
jgi:hypothetical protein